MADLLDGDDILQARAELIVELDSAATLAYKVSWGAQKAAKEAEAKLDSAKKLLATSAKSGTVFIVGDTAVVRTDAGYNGVVLNKVHRP